MSFCSRLVKYCSAYRKSATPFRELVKFDGVDAETKVMQAYGNAQYNLEHKGIKSENSTFDSKADMESACKAVLFLLLY